MAGEEITGRREPPMTPKGKAGTAKLSGKRTPAGQDSERAALT